MLTQYCNPLRVVSIIDEEKLIVERDHHVASISDNTGRILEPRRVEIVAMHNTGFIPRNSLAGKRDR